MMRFRCAACVLGLWLLSCSSSAAEVFIRWDQAQVPPAVGLGISTLVVPARNAALVKAAIASGYRVYLEVDRTSASGSVQPSGNVAGVVIRRGVSAAHVRELRLRFDRVVMVDDHGKWPHIRTNWVTKNNEVLQVTGRSAQPWIENNAALFRILGTAAPSVVPTVTYAWQPITLSDRDEGPALENYLVAIAEAGSFGADLVLPLHERFERRLLLGEPEARAEWKEIRRYLEFYSWNLPSRYRPIANIGVIARDPMAHFEAMNLLARHNLPFEILAPGAAKSQALDHLKLAIVFDAADVPGAALDAFAKRGGIVHRVQKPIGDPNAFALEMRKLLGADDRVIDIWNGITVLTAPYAAPGGGTVLVTALNYAHQPLPLQLRVKGTFSVVHYESPEEGVSLLALQHRNGYTEFVLPALRVGGRVFLGHEAKLDR